MATRSPAESRHIEWLRSLGFSLSGSGSLALQEDELLSDGPHVFWTGEDSVRVETVERGRIVRQELVVPHEVTIQVPEGALARPYAFHRRTFEPEASQYEGVSRILAVSDVHGHVDRLADLLKHHQVVDERLGWCWGDGHLVIVGDIMDRGPTVTEALWMVHRLEREAEACGGKVHFLLGNHEMMVLQGDTRYSHAKYLQTSAMMGRSYGDLFGLDAELGRWLRSKNMAVRLNDLLFVHAGVSPMMAERFPDLDVANAQGRRLIDAHPVEMRTNSDYNFLAGPDGPLWYRGYFGPWSMDDGLDEDGMEQILGTYGVRAVVIGHTTMPQVKTLLGGRVIAIDTGMKMGLPGEGILWERGDLYHLRSTGGPEPLFS